MGIKVTNFIKSVRRPLVHRQYTRENAMLENEKKTVQKKKERNPPNKPTRT
jgi:hypothetical protein